MTLNELNGRSVTLRELIDAIGGAPLSVPIYQRNYKWDKATAVRLAADLAESRKQNRPKTVALVTLHQDSDGSLRILDGQQRLITVSLLLRALGADGLNITFERDLGIDEAQSRGRFLAELTENSSFNDTALSDKNRLLRNYKEISGIIKNMTDSERREFAEWVPSHTVFLLRVTVTPPVDEFLNLNRYKTPFSICDTVRAKMISLEQLDPASVTEELRQTLDFPEHYVKSAVRLFEELTELLYDDSIYKTVSRSCADPEKTRENRLNIMFARLLPKNNADNGNGYQTPDGFEITGGELAKWLLCLHLYRDILRELREDIKGFGIQREVFEDYNGLIGTAFFDLMYEHSEQELGNTKGTPLANILCSVYSSNLKLMNRYFEIITARSAANRSKTLPRETSDTVRDALEGNKRAVSYSTLSDRRFTDAALTSGSCILERLNGVNEVRVPPEKPPLPEARVYGSSQPSAKEIPAYFGSDSGHRNSVTIRQLLENRLLVIPSVQRDYCMGNRMPDSGNMLDAIRKAFNGNQSLTLSALTVMLSEDRVVIYDGQQRAVTLACVLRLLADIKVSIVFEDRDRFQGFFDSFMKNGEGDSTSGYSADAVRTLCGAVNDLKSRLTDPRGFVNYLLDSVRVDIVRIDNEPSVAEQYFMDINGGLKLKPYEIFKCRVNSAARDHGGEDFARRWSRALDNRWLDAFYRFAPPSYGDESAPEELREIRAAEFIIRMRHWQGLAAENAAPADIDQEMNLVCIPFDNNNQMGTVDALADRLTPDGFEECFNYMERLCAELPTLSQNGSPAGLYAECYCTNESCAKYGIALFCTNEDLYKSVMERFIKNLDSDGYYNINFYNDRMTDVMAWAAIRYTADPDREEKLRNVGRAWNSRANCIKDEAYAYITPLFIGRYPYIPLPVPGYYVPHSNNIVKHILSLKNIADYPDFRLFNNVMRTVVTEEQAVGSLPEMQDQARKYPLAHSYQIYFRYDDRNYFPKLDENVVSALADEFKYGCAPVFVPELCDTPILCKTASASAKRLVPKCDQNENYTDEFYYPKNSAYVDGTPKDVAFPDVGQDKAVIRRL